MENGVSSTTENFDRYGYYRMCQINVRSQTIFEGFAWAENLAFDGIGGLFVAENTRGELWRIAAGNSSDFRWICSPL